MCTRSVRLAFLASLAAAVFSLPRRRRPGATCQSCRARDRLVAGRRLHHQFLGHSLRPYRFRFELPRASLQHDIAFRDERNCSAFWQAKIEASSNGQLAPHALEPTVYDSFYQRGADKKERVKVTFDTADPTVEADPPYPHHRLSRDRGAEEGSARSPERGDAGADRHESRSGQSVRHGRARVRRTPPLQHRIPTT